ncbi:AAA family ATPase [Actinoplanes sp. NPDC024001]|uniref:helix-turn-helix transcriptional regulator n=1 Tax=Actinoplanes sp. NPDC024001 TaxID=3154598 RepID=UPI0033C5FF5C
MPFRVLAAPTGLVGREPERRALSTMVEFARAGRGGAMVVAGEPGIGKTALLSHAMAAAGDATVLATTGLESEASLPYAALGDLLQPLLGHLDVLPPPQAHALRAALALEDHDGEASRYAVCMATLALLTAGPGPILVLVDDVQWIDRPSLSALLFAARRLTADPVAMLLAVRDTSLDLVEAAQLDVLRITGLDGDAARRLLGMLREGRLSPAVAEELWRATGGNPLALADICGALTDDQLTGAAALPEPLPVRAGLQRAFADRITVLPEPVRTALLVVALSASAAPEGLCTALDLLGVGRSALTEAEQAGLVRQEGGRVAFAHPLLRTAVQRTAGLAERRRAYEALAATASGGERAWYLAADVLGPDEQAAAALIRAADEMRHRTGHAEAARALHRAAELTADPDGRARLLLAAADDAQLGGGLTDAAVWLNQARSLAIDPLLGADIALAQGHALSRRGTPAIAQRVLADAAEAIWPADPRRASELLMAAVEPALTEGRYQDALGYARRAADLTADDPAAAQVVLAEILLVTGDVPASRALFDRHEAYVKSLHPVAAAGALSLVGLCRAWLEDYPAAVGVLADVVGAARRAGALTALVRALAYDAEVRRYTGDWLVGYVHAEEALRLARELREVAVLGFLSVTLARYDAARGRRGLAEERLAEAGSIAGPLGTPGLLPLERSARGLLHLVAGEYPEAIACLEGMREFVACAGPADLDFLPWCADLVEAYWRAGYPDQARERLAELAARAVASELPGRQALVARCRAITTPDPRAAEVYFREAMRRHRERPQPFEMARTALLMATTARGTGGRADRRSLLREALVIFERLDAQPYARQAAAELAAGGEPVADRRNSPLSLLTPQELQVAQAVANGMSNPEVAATLFISRKTVESHLSSAYRKLGVQSRTQLVRRLLALDGQDSGAGSGRLGRTVGSA